MYARGRLEEAGEADVLAERHARWALALAQRRRTHRGSTATRRTSAPRSTCCSRATRRPRSPSASRSRRSGSVASSCEEARRRFAVALAAAPELTPLRAEALLAAAAIDFRAGALARGMELAEESHAAAVEIGDARSQWRALQFLGELGVAGDDIDVAIPWLERALALARSRELRARRGARHPFARRRALDARRPRERRPSSWPRASRHSARSSGSSETVPSPLNIAEIRTSLPGAAPGCSTSSRTR